MDHLNFITIINKAVLRGPSQFFRGCGRHHRDVRAEFSSYWLVGWRPRRALWFHHTVMNGAHPQSGAFAKQLRDT